MSAITAAIAGLNAAQARLNVSASNVANSRSVYAEDESGVPVNRPYQPQQVDDQTLVSGEVRAVITPQSPATVPVYDPTSIVADNNGVVQYPNVDQDSEVVNQIMAKNAYEANLKTIQTDSEMYKSLMDAIKA